MFLRTKVGLNVPNLSTSVAQVLLAPPEHVKCFMNALSFRPAGHCDFLDASPQAIVYWNNMNISQACTVRGKP